VLQLQHFYLYKRAIERVIAGVCASFNEKAKKNHVLSRNVLGTFFGIQKEGGRTMPFLNRW
jgi:phage shock protein PspC (stress-responsive transcriptional regulator)